MEYQKFRALGRRLNEVIYMVKNNEVKVFGYCRVSTETQSIERQQRNIKKEYENAILYSEAYTGVTQERPEWAKLKKRVKPGQTIVFDSVSRMSRSAEGGVKEYFELYEAGVNLVFLKEPHINTSVYKQQLENASLGMTDNEVVNAVLEGVSNALRLLAVEQIKIAFQQSEKEVMDLRQRTIEGLETARKQGRVGGIKKGTKLETKKSIVMKKKIEQMSRDFNGVMLDKEVMETLGISRNTYYKYKREMLYSEVEAGENNE